MAKEKAAAHAEEAHTAEKTRKKGVKAASHESILGCFMSHAPAEAGTSLCVSTHARSTNRSR